MIQVRAKGLSHRSPGLYLLLLLPLLIGCRVASNDLAATQEAPPRVAETDAPTLVSAEEEVPPTTAPTLSPTLSPTAVPTDTPEATATRPDEATTMIGTEQEANADVEFVRAVQRTDGSWTFHVTVRHPDLGWEDYADGWDVVTDDGLVLKQRTEDPFTRLLLHPHESEQPFTRSQSGLLIPEGNSQVTVRAHDLVDGYGGRQIVVDLNTDAGPGFEVER